MRIPSKVKVLGQDFDVVFLPKEKMKDALGMSCPDTNTIKLRKCLKGDKLGEVFIHEVMHSIEQTLNMDLGEDTINNLSVGVYAFLKENGYLTKEKQND